MAKNTHPIVPIETRRNTESVPIGKDIKVKKLKDEEDEKLWREPPILFHSWLLVLLSIKAKEKWIK